MGRQQKIKQERKKEKVPMMEEKYVAQVTIKVTKLIQVSIPDKTGVFQQGVRTPVEQVTASHGEGSTPLGAVAMAFGEMQLSLDAGISVSVEGMFKKAFEEEAAEAKRLSES